MRDFQEKTGVEGRLLLQYFQLYTGLPAGNPILGHNILGHFCPILGHFLYLLGHFGGNK